MIDKKRFEKEDLLCKTEILKYNIQSFLIFDTTYLSPL